MLSLLLHGNIDMAPRRNPFLPPSWQRCDVATTAALQAAAVRRMCDTVLLPPSPPARAQCPIDDMDQLTCARLSSLRFAAETLPAGSACATSVQNLIAALLQVEAMMPLHSCAHCVDGELLAAEQQLVTALRRADSSLKLPSPAASGFSRALAEMWETAPARAYDRHRAAGEGGESATSPGRRGGAKGGGVSAMLLAVANGDRPTPGGSGTRALALQLLREHELVAACRMSVASRIRMGAAQLKALDPRGLERVEGNAQAIALELRGARGQARLRHVQSRHPPRSVAHDLAVELQRLLRSPLATLLAPSTQQAGNGRACRTDAMLSAASKLSAFRPGLLPELPRGISATEGANWLGLRLTGRLASCPAHPVFSMFSKELGGNVGSADGSLNGTISGELRGSVRAVARGPHASGRIVVDASDAAGGFPLLGGLRGVWRLNASTSEADAQLNPRDARIGAGGVASGDPIDALPGVTAKRVAIARRRAALAKEAAVLLSTHDPESTRGLPSLESGIAIAAARNPAAALAAGTAQVSALEALLEDSRALLKESSAALAEENAQREKLRDESLREFLLRAGADAHARERELIDSLLGEADACDRTGSFSCLCVDECGCYECVHAEALVLHDLMQQPHRAGSSEFSIADLSAFTPRAVVELLSVPKMVQQLFAARDDDTIDADVRTHFISALIAFRASCT